MYCNDSHTVHEWKRSMQTIRASNALVRGITSFSSKNGKGYRIGRFFVGNASTYIRSLGLNVEDFAVSVLRQVGGV